MIAVTWCLQVFLDRNRPTNVISFINPFDFLYIYVCSIRQARHYHADETISCANPATSMPLKIIPDCSEEDLGDSAQLISVLELRSSGFSERGTFF